MWNQLNGDYISGWAPADLMSGTSSVDGVDYPWQYGYNYQYMSPYGYCVAASFSVGNWLGFGFTTSATPYASYSNSSGYCTQVTNGQTCTNTSNPRYPVNRVLVGGPGLLCAAYYNTIVFKVSGLFNFGPSIEVYGPGYCTPIY